MIKLRKWKNIIVTLRVDDLQPGDRFVFDKIAVKVAAPVVPYNGEIIVLMETTHFGSLREVRSTSFPSEQLITIARY